MLSIVIPTYNEEDNILAIVDKIEEVLKKKEFEIIFVDDSTDNTLEKLKVISNKKNNVRYFHRVNEKGLATAVVNGFKKAKGNIIAVMDADLQHPPEILSAMLYAIEKDKADIVIPSRFINGGNDGGLNVFRKLISYTARSLGKVFIKKLHNFSDNTSGYFMFKKEIINDCTLNPIGWKILIEVLVKANYTNVIEIPYEFRARDVGESKMNAKEQINYIRHILRIIKENPSNLRFFSFCIVGVTGVCINLIVYSILVKLGCKITIASFFSGLTAMTTNFILNDLITWRERQSRKLYWRLTKNFTTSLIGIGINVSILFILEKYTKINYIIANLMGIILATVWNYAINNLWTWKDENEIEEHNVNVVKWTISKSNEIMDNIEIKL